MTQATDSFDIVVVSPMTGILGIMGPSMRAATMMAAQDINDEGGILGRRLVVHQVDAGRSHQRVLQDIRRASPSGQPDVLVGTHPSALRAFLTARIDGRFPYVYTPHYEGGERHRGVYPIGETPLAQVRLPILLLSRRLALRRWFLVGHDYIWPRAAARIAREAIGLAGGSVVGERFASLRRSCFDEDLDAIAASGAEAVTCFLIGQGAIDFHRAFAARGLAGDVVRFTPDVEENLLLALGEAGAENLHSCSGYFESLASAANFAFLSRYRARFGALAPLQNGYSESLMNGLWFAKSLVEAAGGTDIELLERASDGLVLNSPRGRAVYSHKTMEHSTYLASARNGRLYVTDRFAVTH